MMAANRMLCLASIVLLTATMARPAFAEPADRGPRPLSVASDEKEPDGGSRPRGSSLDSLDDELLEGLDDELFEGLELDEQQPADEDAAKDPPPRREPSRDRLDDDLLRDLEGELGIPDQDEDPLARIVRQMREAGKRIGQKQSNEPTQQLQRRIVQDLDQLIEQAKKQAQQNMQAQSSGQQGSRRSQPQEPDEQQAGDGSGQGGDGGESREGPSQDSSERLGRDELRRADMVEMNELLKNLWGHLPEREREQVINMTMEQFVPKYELLIEEYFKRLVEERSGNEGR